MNDVIKRTYILDKYAAYLGIELLEAGEGYCKVRLPIKEQFLNAADVVHGGLIFTLADVAFAVASNSHGQLALAINANISFLRSKYVIMKWTVLWLNTTSHDRLVIVL